MRPKPGLAALLCLLATGLLFGQTSGAPGSGQTQPGSQPAGGLATAPASRSAAAAGAMPPGFGPSQAAPENPWRRFEIVSLGSFPIMLFYTQFGADFGLYASHGFNQAYAPWPFKTVSSYSPGTSEQVARLGAAFVLSLVIGGIDAVIHAAKTRPRHQVAPEAPGSQSPAPEAPVPGP